MDDVCRRRSDDVQKESFFRGFPLAREVIAEGD
jgi:hypothetical protein